MGDSSRFAHRPAHGLAVRREVQHGWKTTEGTSVAVAREVEDVDVPPAGVRAVRGRVATHSVRQIAEVGDAARDLAIHLAKDLGQPAHDRGGGKPAVARPPVRVHLVAGPFKGHGYPVQDRALAVRAERGARSVAGKNPQTARKRADDQDSAERAQTRYRCLMNRAGRKITDGRSDVRHPLPVGLLDALLVLFAADAERGFESSLQPLEGNELSALFTQPEGAFLDLLKRVVDLLQKRLFAPAQPERE